MSLKAGAERSAAGSPFLIGFGAAITARGKVENVVFVFHFSAPRRGGGNVGIAQRFPRAGENEGKPGFGFPSFSPRPSFPKPFPVAFMRSACGASGRTACVSRLAFPWRLACRILPPLLAATDRR